MNTQTFIHSAPPLLTFTLNIHIHPIRKVLSGCRVHAASSIELGARRVVHYVFLHAVEALAVLTPDVPDPVGLALEALRAEHALKSRLLAALPVGVALQRVFAHVRATAAHAIEVARGPTTRLGLAVCKERRHFSGGGPAPFPSLARMMDFEN